MPKPSKEQLSKREEKAAEYKWEILRRSTDYEQERDQILKLGQRLNDEEEYSNYIKQVQGFYKKWRIKDLLEPNTPYEYLLPKEKWSLRRFAVITDKESTSFLLRKLVPAFHKDIPTLKIEIDLAVPKEKIMHEVGELIDIAKEVKKEGGIGKKPRISNYKKLLRIYDLRETKTKEGELTPFSKVAKKIYPHREITKTLQDTIRKSYITAKQLVKNAHKDVW